MALYDHEMALEKASKDRAGRRQVLRPDYMRAIIIDDAEALIEEMDVVR